MVNIYTVCRDILMVYIETRVGMRINRDMKWNNVTGMGMRISTVDILEGKLEHMTQ